MTSSPAQEIRCVVEGENKLPPGIGAQAICTAIERAAATELRRAGIAPETVSIVVLVRSLYAISATASVGANSLPDQHVAASDRALDARAIDMLANGVALELSKLKP